MDGNTTNVKRSQTCGRYNGTGEVVRRPNAASQCSDGFNEERFSRTSHATHKHVKWLEGGASALAFFVFVLVQEVVLHLVKDPHGHEEIVLWKF